MPNRDTYDIEEAERIDREEALDLTNSNIQISSVMAMMQHSEPELFGKGTAKLMTVKTNQDINSEIVAKGLMLKWAKLHAQEQITFWDEFLK